MIAVLRAGIDRVVKALVDLVKALGIAGVAQHPQFLVDRLRASGAPPAVIRSAASPAHSASSSAIASNIPVSRSSEGRATTAPRWARASTRPLATSWRSASRTGVRDTQKRRAMSVSSSADAGRQHAAHDLVGELQPQFFRARDLVRRRRRRGRRGAPCVSASRRDGGVRSGDRRDSCLRILRLVDDADMGGDDLPAFRETAPRSASAARPCPARCRDRTASRRPRYRGHRS